MVEKKRNTGESPEESQGNAAANMGPAHEAMPDWAKDLPPGFTPITRDQIRAEKSAGHGTITDNNLYLPGVTAIQWQKLIGGVLAKVHGGEDKTTGRIGLVGADPLDTSAIPVVGVVTEGVTIAIGGFLSRLGFKLPAGTKTEVPVMFIGKALVVTVTAPEPKDKRQLGPRKKPGADDQAKQ